MDPAIKIIERDFKLSVGLYNVLGKILRKLRKQAGKQPFSTTEQAIMALLDSNGKMLPSELADAHFISAQAISQMINRLHEQGAVEKHPDPEDKRKVYLSLTPSGLQQLLAIRLSRSKWLSGAVSEQLSQKEKDTLKEAVEILGRLAG